MVEIKIEKQTGFCSLSDFLVPQIRTNVSVFFVT